MALRHDSTRPGTGEDPVERWNPRYVAYANAHGRTALEQLDFDRRRFPGGPMTPYLLWKDTEQ